MFWLWVFWVEALAFSSYVLWYLLSQSGEQYRSGYQWADLIIYGIAFIYGLYGFVRFARRYVVGRRLRTSR